MVLDHWSNDAMVSMDRCGLVGSSSISTGELITNQKLTIAPWFRMPSEPRVHPQENVTAMDTFRTPLLKLHGRRFGFSTRPHVSSGLAEHLQGWRSHSHHCYPGASIYSGNSRKM